MSPVGVVPAFDPFEHCLFGLAAGGECGPVEYFTFEGGEEAFGHGVVVTVSDASHRGGHPMLVAATPEGDRGAPREHLPPQCFWCADKK